MKLCLLCCQTYVSINNTDTLKMIYFAFFHLIIKYGIMLWTTLQITKGSFSYKREF
jgi:hypothetical protein